MAAEKVFWSWNKGKTIFQVEHDDETKQIISSDEVPPTFPSHDIAHIICCFHGMPWNFKHNINEVAEYNAVYLEHIFSNFCNYYIKQIYKPIEHHIEINREYTNHFSENYYHIPQNCDISTQVLEKNFMDHLNPEICSIFIWDYFHVLQMESMMPKEELVVSYTLQKDITKKSQSFYNFISDYKKIFFEKYYQES